MQAIQNFRPVMMVTATQEATDQDLHPAVNDSGIPLWQEADTNMECWEITSIGWCHGPIDSRTMQTGLKGWVYVTDSRVIVASGDFANGATFSSWSMGFSQVVAYGANKLSKARARKAVEGNFLVGQMRLPWIGGVAWGAITGAKQSRGEVRLIGAHLTPFGDIEKVMLIFKLKRMAETEALVDAVVSRIVADRLASSELAEEHRHALSEVPRAAAVEVHLGKLSVIDIVGTGLVARGNG